MQQPNACTTGEDIRPDLRIKAIKKKVNLFLCSRLEKREAIKGLNYKTGAEQVPGFRSEKGKVNEREQEANFLLVCAAAKCLESPLPQGAAWLPIILMLSSCKNYA